MSKINELYEAMVEDCVSGGHYYQKTASEWNGCFEKNFGYSVYKDAWEADLINRKTEGRKNIYFLDKTADIDEKMAVAKKEREIEWAKYELARQEENLARIQERYEENLRNAEEQRDRELKFHEEQIKKYLELVGEEN